MRPTLSSVMRRRGGCMTVVRIWRMVEVTVSMMLILTASSKHSLVEAWEAWVVMGWEDRVSTLVEHQEAARASASSSVKKKLRNTRILATNTTTLCLFSVHISSSIVMECKLSIYSPSTMKVDSIDQINYFIYNLIFTPRYSRFFS